MQQELNKETTTRVHTAHNPSPKSMPASTNQHTEAAQKGGYVLIVEDDDDMREVLGRSISLLLGYETRTAEDGLEALVLIGEQMPDLILLDLMMPKMSGFQVLHRLQRSPVTRRIPVFVVSALEQQQILSLPGVSHVFSKGQFRLQELMTAVKDVVEPPKTSSSGNLIGSLNGVSG